MKKSNTQSIGNPLPLRIIRRSYPIFERAMPRAAHKLAYNLFFTPMRYKTPPRELPILSRASKSFGIVNGKKTQFYSWGNVSNPMVVLAHGWMGRASQFYKIIDALLERQYHIVAFDGPAHGASEGIKTNVIEFAEALSFIQKKYGAFHFAVGHSFGGLSLVYAISVGVKIDNIAFIATPSISDDIVRQFEEKINASPATGQYFVKELYKRHGVDFKEISASELIRKIKINSLFLIHDETDRDVAIEHAQLMKERFPSADTLFTKGLGHTRILRNDEVITQLVKKIDLFRK